jgi:hypothetical protein
MSKERANKLKCRYISYHPALKIAPVKEELLHDDPPIWMFHDVITETQTQIMKSLASPIVNKTKNTFISYIFLRNWDI